MENLNNTEIQRSHTAKQQQWKVLTDVVNAVNCDAHDRLATFIHRQAPEAGDTDRRKAFMHSYLLPQRNNWLKLKTLVSWSEKASLVKDYEVHYENVQSQKFISNKVEIQIQGWSFYMPSSSLRTPDVTSASDVLKEGTYKRFPSIIKERYAPDVLDDDKAKETLEALNGIIQIRMLTQEIIPRYMRNYSISNGKIKFIIDKEFEVVLTPVNMEIDSPWWIVDLKFLIQSASDRILNDVKLSFHDDQVLGIMETIQKQYLSPPSRPIPERIASSMKRSVNAETSEATSSHQTAKFCPLVNLYEYLHNYCLDLQLYVLCQQAYYMSQSRWANNFEIVLRSEDSVLQIRYWSYIKHAALQAKRSASITKAQEVTNHDIIEISVVTEESDRHLLYSSNKALKKSHWYTDTKYVKLGALNDIRGINYPHKFLRVRWSGLKGSEGKEWIIVDWGFDPTNLNIEHLMLSVTQRHAKAVIDKFAEILKNEKGVYTENDFEIVSGHDELTSADSSFSDEVARKYLDVQKLRIRLCGDFKDYFVNIGIDIHSGRIFIEDEKQEIESDKIKACEDKLSYDHNKLIEVLIMLRSVVMMSQLESMARKLFLDVPREIHIHSDDNKKLPTTQKIILEFYDIKDADKSYYLIAGLVESGIVYSLVTLSRIKRTERTENHLLSDIAKEPSHRISSINHIRLENATFDTEKLRMDNLTSKSPQQFLKDTVRHRYINESNHTRKRSFDKMNEDEVGPTLARPIKRASDTLETDFNSPVVEELLLARIVSIARSRIDYEKVESCFNEKEVKLEPIRPNNIRGQIGTAKCMSPEADFDEAIDKSLDFLDASAPLSLSTTIPTFKISIRSLLARFPRANDLCLNIFSDVFVRLAGARLTKMTNSEIILTTCLQSRYIPKMVKVFLHTNITYDQSLGVLTFRYKYKNKENFVATFLEDFEKIVMMTQAACECKRILYDKKKLDISILDFDFDTLKLQYYPYGIDISWCNDEYSLALYDLTVGAELYTKEDFCNSHKDKLHAFLKEELNSACAHNFDRFIDSLKIIPSIIRFLIGLSMTRDNYVCELQVIPKGATKFHLIWGFSIPPDGQQIYCGMGISFVQAEDEAYFFASDLANLKEYQALKPRKMPIWQAFGQELVYKQEAGLNKVEMLASGFTSPNVSFEKIIDWIDEYVRKRAPWLS